MPGIIFKARKSLHAHINLLKPFDGIPQMVITLFQKGFTLGIVSSNSRENVLSWLEHHQLIDYFAFIHAGSTYYGKKRVLKKALKVNKIDQAFYIGDETRDIDAAKHVNIHSMAVTWGFNSERILAKHQPHCIARAPKDIISLSLKYK
jgi:phosphoglycolate phosphatase